MVLAKTGILFLGSFWGTSECLFAKLFFIQRLIFDQHPCSAVSLGQQNLWGAVGTLCGNSDGKAARGTTGPTPCMALGLRPHTMVGPRDKAAPLILLAFPS